ncbi:uncharacterized protein [Nothobranchius furzeri]|uniref:uncharacterized protein n=1 Tax=Nothobranchius furzeri TaxID=105023 RepID=UPI003904C02F
MAPNSFVWTDKEVELLLNVVLEYKVNNTQEGIDWESCQSKYADIMTLFLEQYPTETSTDFPHGEGGLTRASLTTKIKAIRTKYRLAVDSGRRSGFGRVVLLYFDLCEQIWGGSPATTTMLSGIETTDLDDSLPVPSPSTSSSCTMEPSDNEQESSGTTAVKQRRDLLQAKLRGHRHDRLKRKLPAETQWLNALEEDQRAKKKLIDLLEKSEKQASDNFVKVTNALEMLTTSIAEGFSLLRQVVQPPPAQSSHYMPYEARGHMYAHTPSLHPLQANQALHSFSNSSPSVRGTQQNATSYINTQDASSSSMSAERTGLTAFSYTQALFSDE